MRAANAVVAIAIAVGGIGCTSSSLATPDRACGQTTHFVGYAEPLPGHAPSRTPDAALRLFLTLNAETPTTTPPTFDPSRFLGVMPLPMTGWVRVKALKGLAAYEHRRRDGRGDYTLDFARTQNPNGWSITGEGRCVGA